MDSGRGLSRAGAREIGRHCSLRIDVFDGWACCSPVALTDGFIGRSLPMCRAAGRRVTH
jgi:hypothetical protein